MSDQIDVSRNSARPASGALKFHGPGGPRPILVAAWAILAIFFILPACGEEASDDESTLQGSSPRRLDGVSNIMDSADDAFLSTSERSGRTTTNSKPEGRWSMLLASVGGPNHPIQAQAVRNRIASDYPVLRSAFVRPQGKGSAVWFGRFGSPTDSDAAATRDMVRGLRTRNGQPAFPQSFLSILPDDSPVGEHDLRVVRTMYPRVDPLYSLQVACWGTFGTTEVSPEEVRARAEAEVRELRSRGYEAWYYHDPVTELSVVTIGAFDSRAYDGRSTLFSPEVEALMRDFPAHRVNGEEVQVELTPGDPTTRIPQPCRLVMVPALP